MIGFKDFPTPFKAAFGYTRQAEEDARALEQVNDWIHRDQVNVVSAETIHGYGIRIWYQDASRPARTTLPKSYSGHSAPSTDD